MATKKAKPRVEPALRKAVRAVRPIGKSVRQKHSMGAAHPTKDDGAQDTNWLTVVGARQNNLRNITVEIPLGRFVCVTGVSGSGKSSLVNDIIREVLARDLNAVTLDDLTAVLHLGLAPGADWEPAAQHAVEALAAATQDPMARSLAEILKELGDGETGRS